MQSLGRAQAEPRQAGPGLLLTRLRLCCASPWPDLLTSNPSPWPDPFAPAKTISLIAAGTGIAPIYQALLRP